MKDFWNERYQAKEFAYGIEPNQFLANEIKKLRAGKILLPFEGEGRNAVFCAKEAWKVDAFDFSKLGKQKAEKLADANQVSINYTIHDLKEFPFSENTYDAVALIFAHPAANYRKYLHQQSANCLKTGGRLILEAFHQEQLTKGRSSGGPKNFDMLLNEEMLKKDFENLEIELLQKVEIELQEGNYHNGRASIIRLVAKK